MIEVVFFGLDNLHTRTLCRALQATMKMAGHDLGMHSLRVMLISKNYETDIVQKCGDYLRTRRRSNPKKWILVTEQGSRLDHVVGNGFLHHIVVPFKVCEISKSVYRCLLPKKSPNAQSKNMS